MKQPKKRWAWTARQRGRIRLYSSWHYQRYQPDRFLRQLLWNRHRMQTRMALHQIRQGAEETEVQFPYQHKHNGHWLCD
ncbi:hypothetical protein [Hymenobacter chitinivorans]|uniref:Uncharacterized protein n=1 Tax=Hymenobacter chitinivorans DSM 11115 TaxID=1121954 RepID=A0A2M9BQC6_9BACT|nr:hypothetical protein [Hymenobacter chitinivorans]PJJ60163.1 hypothetical protein CLV45_1588 [Hymenobacter chitinivorans DSM 11115]